MLLLGAVDAVAQSRDIGSTAPAVFTESSEYRAPAHHLGSLSLSVGGEARIEYDDNVFAEPQNTNDDARFELSPALRLRTPPGPLSAQVAASGTLRRFATLTSENSDAWLVDGHVRWSPDKSSVASGRLFWQRSVEERGDPESNVGALFGPRLTDSFGGEARYRRDSGHVLLDLEASATRYDAVAKRDANRDFTNSAGRATFGLRTTPTLFVTATLFAARRDFRIERTPAGTKRNSATYGARVGVDIQPGGLFEGNFSAGIFRFEPEDPQSNGRTGVSVAGSLVYRPRRRTAILLNASSGDTATFRSGAQQRTDTGLKLSLQQEIRHNLFATPTFGFRETKYTGSGDKQRTLTFGAEVEYIMSRNLSVTVAASYGDRKAYDDVRDNFSRFRGGMSLRIRF